MLEMPSARWFRARKDPLHDFFETLAERLSADCETELVVFIEFDRFLAHMSTFDRVVFVEPLVLFGSKELEVRTRIWLRAGAARRDVVVAALLFVAPLTSMHAACTHVLHATATPMGVDQGLSLHAVCYSPHGSRSCGAPVSGPCQTRVTCTRRCRRASSLPPPPSPPCGPAAVRGDQGRHQAPPVRGRAHARQHHQWRQAASL